jgi:CheY-like chemotaxis protein
MCLALENAGFVVSQAPDGAQGVACCRAEHPDVVIADLDMLHGGGLEVIRLLRHELPEVRVIACSAEADRQHLGYAVQAGALAALRMPFQVPELLELVERFDTPALVA